MCTVYVISPDSAFTVLHLDFIVFYMLWDEIINCKIG